METTMRELFDELEQLLEIDDEVEIEEEAAIPPCEILQRGSELCIRVELPGVPRDNILVTSADHLLVIEATRPDPGERNTVWSSEITHGIYRRMITLPPGVDTSAIDASYTDGILEIRLAVPPQLQARRIPITNGHRQLTGKPT
jgi:HSP20 family protein